MDEAAAIPAQGEYKERRAGLIAFGILEIVLGLLCALVLIAMFVALSLAPQTSMALSRQAMGFSLAFYGLIGAVLIWLGVGSILCRRWARALILVASWSCLVGGIISLGFYAVFARDIFARAVAPSASSAMAMALAAAMLAIFFILLPGAMVLFYQRKDVAATCAARDPVTRWTDRCPLQVLTCSLWLGVCAISCLFTPAIYGSIVPWFGTLLTGPPATLVLLVCAAVCLYLAWATYRLRIEGWWITLAAFTIFSVLATWTLLRIDLMEVYRGFGYPEQQIEQLRNLRFFTGKTMAWWIALGYPLFLVYMIWIRKYFRKG
jgi:hypothetical protein